MFGYRQSAAKTSAKTTIEADVCEKILMPLLSHLLFHVFHRQYVCDLKSFWFIAASAGEYCRWVALFFVQTDCRFVPFSWFDFQDSAKFSRQKYFLTKEHFQNKGCWNSCELWCPHVGSVEVELHSHKHQAMSHELY